MFELSAANLSLFEIEPICSFAEALIDPNCHVVHNNSFTSPPNPEGKGGWHQVRRHRAVAQQLLALLLLLLVLLLLLLLVLLLLLLLPLLLLLLLPVHLLLPG